MKITVDPIIVPPSKITSVSPSLVALSIDDPVPVPDDETELEKLVESSDVDLDEVIIFGSLCLLMIPKTFLSTGISTTNIVANNPVYHIDIGNLHNDETIVAGSKSKTCCLNKVDTTIINLVTLLHSVKFFDTKFKSNVRMHGAISKQIITYCAVG